MVAPVSALSSSQNRAHQSAPREDGFISPYEDDELFTTDYDETVPYSAQDFRNELTRVERQRSRVVMFVVLVVIVLALIAAGLFFQMI